MSESMEILRRKIHSAEQLGSVVGTMKALAAASIVQYERAVLSLADYYHAIELGLCACFKGSTPVIFGVENRLTPYKPTTTAIVFGSDQGLVGQFNDHLAAFVLSESSPVSGDRKILAIGERIAARLEDAGFSIGRSYTVPNSVMGITSLVSQILIDQENASEMGETYVFHNRPAGGTMYEPVKQRLLPLDAKWQSAFERIQWPTNLPPEALGSFETTVRSLIREYLFVSLFKACAESLASENACRLAAMQRAERNIDELLERLRMVFHQTRQTTIDEELFDVIAGFEAMTGADRGRGAV
jgi:F-type H+-transporting ATPase subunit gamma